MVSALLMRIDDLPMPSPSVVLRRMTRSLLTAALLAPLLACASIPERHPLPPELHEEASLPGLPRVRFWGDTTPPFVDEWLAESDASLQARLGGVMDRPHAYLAVSGGGQNGAFGAGLLKGWTARGTRPEFTIVTGISTGALIAPFAFLGPDYDDELEEVYTSYSSLDLVEPRSTLKTVTGDSAASTAPLRAKIAEAFDREVVDAIARESATGRELLIGTTNMDAGRSVIWNMGAIAASDAPGALDLFHDVLLASASIPVAFPPVMIEVEANGERYDEMHLDGGATTQVFWYPAGLDWTLITERLRVQGKPQLYVIRNGTRLPPYQITERSLLAIADRTFTTLFHTQGVGNLFQLYANAERDGMDFHLARIPADFEHPFNEPFDNAYMRALFQRGYEFGLEGPEWSTQPEQFYE